MKTKFALMIFILIIVVPLLSLSSCRETMTGTEVAVSFLNDICKSDFESAYGWVSTDMTKSNFIQEYTGFFETLGITSVEFKNTASFETKTYSTYNYSLTYTSSVCGDITDDYSITVRLNDKNVLYVDWSPALMLPEMEAGDKVYRTRISAQRGDIITDQTILAENVPLITISVQTEEYSNKQITDNLKIICDTLSLDYNEEVKKVSYTVCLDVKQDKEVDSADVVSDKDFEEQLDRNIELISEKLNMSKEELKNSVDSCKEDTLTIGTYLPDDIDSSAITAFSIQKGISVQSSIYSGFALIAEYSPVRIEDTTTNKLSQYDGIKVSDSSFSTTRYYPLGSLLAHSVGYTWSMEKETVEEEIKRLNDGRNKDDGLYTRYSVTGRNGIEQAYETQLRGKDGYTYCVRSTDGRNKRTLFEKPAEDGLDVQLTIDIDLQEKAEALLENTLYGSDTAGAVIVMNPQTGAVEAIASYPTYDLNLYASGITPEENAEYMKMNSPFLNRALQGRYAPGSVYKPITAAAALENNAIGTDYVFTGEIVNDTWKIPEKYGSTSSTDRIKRTHVNRRYSPLNMRNALLHSDNIYFANAALILGDTRMEEYWNKLRMNEKIDFELPISSSQFKSASAEDRNVIQIAETGFGQGTMLVTPLQLAATYCAFANNGDIPTPHIVEGIYREDGSSYTAVERTQRSIWKNDAIDSYVCSKMTEMLKDVVSSKYNGTGQRLNVTSCTVAGKTGTAEVEKGIKDNSWFVGYRTDVSDADQRLVLVVLEVPADEKYTALKFSIARGLLELDDNE